MELCLKCCSSKKVNKIQKKIASTLRHCEGRVPGTGKQNSKENSKSSPPIMINTIFKNFFIDKIQKKIARFDGSDKPSA